MSYNAKNYTEQGGEKTVIGGTLEIASGASVTGITTATIADNLTTNDATKALSAKQGVTLKALVDAKYTAENATEAVAGLVKMSAVQADTTTETIVDDFNALIDKLQAAGLMATTD